MGRHGKASEDFVKWEHGKITCAKQIKILREFSVDFCNEIDFSGIKMESLHCSGISWYIQNLVSCRG